MRDHNISEAQFRLSPAEGGQDLLVDAVLPADGGVIAKEPRLLDHGAARGIALWPGMLLQDIAGVLIAEPDEQLQQPLSVSRVEAFIGIQPENPVAGGLAKRLIACGEAIDPGEVDDLGPERGSDLSGTVHQPEA